MMRYWPPAPPLSQRPGVFPAAGVGVGAALGDGDRAGDRGRKLHWYRLGGGTSERQWRDVVSIVLLQGSRLDRQYLLTVAEKIVVNDLLQQAYRSVNGVED
jgi:hypothetical protein